MDDFGIGYSSLSTLRRFPFDKVKIDQSFVRDLSSREDSIHVIRAVAGLCEGLGMTTTAEGVETVEQLAEAERGGLHGKCRASCSARRGRRPRCRR